MKSVLKHGNRVGISLSYPFLLTFLLVSLIIPNKSSGYFQDFGLGVRPIGMGDSFVAVADDSNTLLWNAAGLADLEKREINLMYASLFSGLEARLFTGDKDILGYNNIALAWPVDPEIGNFGAGWTLFNSEFYQENSFIIGYGREIGTELFNWLQVNETIKNIRLNAGINLKILNWSVDENQFTQSNSALNVSALNRTNMTADLALLMHYIENVKVGLSFENIIPADFGILTREPIPFNFRLGTSYLHLWDNNTPYVDSLLGTLEFTYRSNLADIRVGAEGWFFDQLIALRFGTTVDNFATGLSVNTVLPNTPIDVRLDYAFTYPYAVQSTFGSHRFSLVLRWGTLVNSKRRSLTSEELERLVEPDKDEIAAREAELARQREAERKRLEAKLKAYHEELKQSQLALKKIKERIELGELPAIMFASGTSRMKKPSLRTLAEIAKILEKYPQAKVRIEGHTDSVGQASYNLKLSRERAQAVADHLTSMYNLDSNHVMATGYGENRPIASNETAKGRRKNRRVEIKVIFPDNYSEGVKSAPQRIKENADITPQPAVPAGQSKSEERNSKVHQLKMDTQEVEKMFEQQNNDNKQ